MVKTLIDRVGIEKANEAFVDRVQRLDKREAQVVQNLGKGDTVYVFVTDLTRSAVDL